MAIQAIQQGRPNKLSSSYLQIFDRVIQEPLFDPLPKRGFRPPRQRSQDGHEPIHGQQRLRIPDRHLLHHFDTPAPITRE